MQPPSVLSSRRWDRITARTHCGNVSPNMGRPLSPVEEYVECLEHERLVSPLPIQVSSHRSRFLHDRYQVSTRALASADLLASPLPSMSASIFRAREAGTRAFMMRFRRPGIIIERFLSRPLRPSDTHCSTPIGFSGMVFGSRPNFSSTAVFVNPAASTVT